MAKAKLARVSSPTLRLGRPRKLVAKRLRQTTTLQVEDALFAGIPATLLHSAATTARHAMFAEAITFTLYVLSSMAIQAAKPGKQEAKVGRAKGGKAAMVAKHRRKG